MGLKSKLHAGLNDGEKVISSPRTRLANIGWKKDKPLSEKSARRIFDFSNGYNLIDIEQDFENKSKSYLFGVIKRYKNESFYNKYFTPLNYFYKEAKKFKENNKN
jgi:hypothetical protein